MESGLLAPTLHRAAVRGSLGSGNVPPARSKAARKGPTEAPLLGVCDRALAFVTAQGYSRTTQPTPPRSGQIRAGQSGMGCPGHTYHPPIPVRPHASQRM